MLRAILRISSRTILLHITFVVVLGLVISYAIMSAPDSPPIRSEKGGAGYILVSS